MATETSSHILCELAALAELRLCASGKHLMERRDYDKNPLYKIMYFIRTGLLPE
jgi:hypothetical protein